MKYLAGVLVVAMSAGVVSAQPGVTPPGVPAPYAYRPAPLTAEEEAIVDEGEISDEARYGGMFVGFTLGFGLGQALQGRWHARGWIFTFGELLSVAGLIYATQVCKSCDQGDAGPNGVAFAAIAWSTFRIWGGLDALIAPSSYNEHVRQLRARAGYGMYLAPPQARDPGAIAGLRIGF